MTHLPENSLVLYKTQPARVTKSGEKPEIALPTGRTIKVRPKDVQLLHPGPLKNLAELKATPSGGDVRETWELLAGETVSLAELAEWLFDADTPAAVWAAWQIVVDGLYFSGTPEAITPNPAEAVAAEQAARRQKAEEADAWRDVVGRVQAGRIQPDDHRYLSDVERLATGQQSASPLLRELNRPETPEAAHALLLSVGYWPAEHNPHPARLGLPTTPPALAVPPLPAEDRLDLTHLPAFAIDDAGSTDPDDALSLDGNRLWVHVADVAALVEPDSPLEAEARARGANLYLPDGTVPILPPEIVPALALGLSDVSPALSFGLDVDAAGHLTGFEIAPSWVRVTRLSYDEAEARLTEAPFASLHRLAEQLQARRIANGAVEIDLPEVKVRVVDGRVAVTPLPALRSRNLVREAMLLCGEAVARYANEAGLPIPFATQPPPDEARLTESMQLDGMAGMFARRRAMNRGQTKSIAEPHAGLGLELYAQATSPLRRYPDMVVHQQIRRHAQNAPVLSAADVLRRLAEAEGVMDTVRQAERLSNQHWKLIFLQQNPGWQGEGVVVDRRGRSHVVLIPALDMETRLHLKGDPPLNTRLTLAFDRANLPELEAYFRVVD